MKRLSLHLSWVVISLCLVLAIWSLGWLDVLESQSDDAAIRHGRKPPVDQKIVLVAIDAASLHSDTLGKPPWRPSSYARILHRLNDLGAKVVAFDVLLEHVYEPQDRQFCRAIQQSRAAVVLACQWVRSEHGDAVEERWTLPAKEFRSTVQDSTGRGPRLGFINLPVEDELIRGYWPTRADSTQQGTVPAFATAIATARGDIQENARPGTQRIRYVGPTGTFRTISVLELMGEIPNPNLDEWLQGATVIVGSTAPEFHDLHDTPMNLVGTTSNRMAGAEVHANIVNMLNHKEHPCRSSNSVSLWWLLLWSALYLTILLSTRPVYSVVALPLCVCAISSSAQQIYDSWLILLPTWTPVIALVLMWGGSIVIRWTTADQQQRKLKQLFSRCLHESIVTDLMNGPNRPTLSGQTREVTVFFCDIRGFTRLSEKLPPERVVELLRDYFESMCRVIYAHQGAVDKFIGDAIMAFFGTPHDDPEHAQKAVRCALQMQAGLEKLNKRWQKQGLPNIKIGIGINTGTVVAGMLGSSRKMEYTVVGDTVNVASRLESLNKQLGTSILVSENTRRAITGEFDFVDQGLIDIRGKAEQLRVFTVADLISGDNQSSVADSHDEVQWATASLAKCRSEGIESCRESEPEVPTQGV